MPPTPPSQTPSTDTSHLIPEHTKTHGSSSVGQITGIIIVVILLMLGGLYFWGAQLNQQEETLPLIPGDSASI